VSLFFFVVSAFAPPAVVYVISFGPVFVGVHDLLARFNVQAPALDLRDLRHRAVFFFKLVAPWASVIETPYCFANGLGGRKRELRVVAAPTRSVARTIDIVPFAVLALKRVFCGPI